MLAIFEQAVYVITTQAICITGSPAIHLKSFTIVPIQPIGCAQPQKPLVVLQYVEHGVVRKPISSGKWVKTMLRPARPTG